MDTIALPRIPVRAHVGVTDDERGGAQDLFVDVTLHLDLAAAGRSDDLDDTVDYDAVCALIEEVVGVRAFHLIETVAQAVADAVLQRFTLTEISVRVEKPGALTHRGVPFAAVEIRRGRDA